MNNRIEPIEGIRGLLAFWVYINHIIGHAGISSLPDGWRFLRGGGYAVDVFVVISGFVIFYLLDHRSQPYLPYLVRRFFRLWPLFIVLYFVSMPFALTSAHNMAQVDHLYGSTVSPAVSKMIDSWWERPWKHTALHLFMVHGMVPDKVVPNSPSAFLGPAWSISLEWQFYLIAPLLFAGLGHARARWRVLAGGLSLGLIWAAREKLLPKVQLGAFLPYHGEFFLLGIASYFLWKHHGARGGGGPPMFLLGLLLGAGLYWLADERDLLPVAVWVALLGGLLDLRASPERAHGGAFWKLFTNRPMLFLGRVSYSFYLVHTLVIVLVQSALLRVWPSLSQTGHAVVLLAVTLPLVLLISAALHRWLEVPGQRLGAVWAGKLLKRT